MVKLEKIIKFGVYSAMILPLIFTSRTMYPWHFGKTILFQVLVEILLVLAIIFFSLNKKRKLVKLNILDWLIFIFVFLQLISAIFGVNFIRSFWGNQQRAQGVFTWLHFAAFYFILRQFLITKKEWVNLGLWLIIIGFISSLLAWLGRYFSVFDNIISSSGQLSGMIGNPIFFASYLIIPAFFSLAWFFMIKRSSRWKWFIFVAAIFSFVTLLFTQVRGAFIGLIIGLAVSWLLYLLFTKSKKIRLTLMASGLLCFILITGGYIINQKSDLIRVSSPALSRLLSITPQEATASTRLMAWRIALKGWQDKPVFGWGPENFQDSFDKHYNPGFLKYSFAETVWDKPHNYPLEVLNSMGIIGFAGYIFILVLLFFYLKRIITAQKDDSGRLIFIALAGGIAAYVLQSIFAFETSNSLLIWLTTIAFISFYYSFYSSESLSFKEKIKSKFSQAALNFIVIIILALTPYLIYKNFTFYKSSVLMGDTRDAADIESLYLWQKNAPKVLAEEVPFLWEQAIFLTKDISIFDAKQILDRKTLEPVAPGLIKIFEKEINKYPTSYVLRFWAGQFYGFMAEHLDKNYYDRSDQLLKEAWQMNKDRQSVALVLAKSYLLQERTAEAIGILEELADKNLDYKEPHWFLGLALINGGQEDRGVEELEKGLGFGTGFKNNILYLIDLYAKRKEYEKIIPLYEQLIKQEPDNASYYASLAATYAALGDEANVIINLDKAVQLEPALAAEAKEFLKQQGIDINKYK